MLSPHLPYVQAKLDCGYKKNARSHGQEDDSQMTILLSGRWLRDAHSIVGLVPREHGEKSTLGTTGTQTQTLSGSVTQQPH